MPKIQFFILIFNLWVNRGELISGLDVLFHTFPAYVGVAIRSHYYCLYCKHLQISQRSYCYLPVHVALNACSLRPAPPRTTHQSTHPPYTRAPKAQWPAGHGEGRNEQGCVCVCVDSGVERVRKKARKKGGWVGLEMQHSVLFISTVSYGTLGKWNACSSG